MARGRHGGRPAWLALAAALILAGCGGGQPAVNVGGPAVNSELRLADCTDWNRASTPEQLGTVRELENFAGGQADTPAGRGAVLTDDQAYDLMESACAPVYARAFKLYKLYERAASFSGH